jgi:hypothetical protein
MDRSTTCRTSITRRVLSVGIILAISAVAALAVPQAGPPASLSLTVAGAGTFTSLPVQVCSLFSPQFTNQTSWKGPGLCVDTITIWVFNGGADPTDGTPVTVSNTFPVGSSKAGTVLAANGFCAFASCGTIAVAANGWNCSSTQGSASCTRSDVLAAGHSYPPIVLKVLVEDAFNAHLTEYDDAATVSGGGSGAASKFTDFSGAVSFPGLAGGFIEVDVHTVPEGLTLVVDGVRVTAGDKPVFWQIGSVHTIQTDDPPGVPLNPGFTLVATNLGGLLTNGFVVGPTGFLVLVTPPEFFVGGVTHDQFTAIYTKPWEAIAEQSRAGSRNQNTALALPDRSPAGVPVRGETQQALLASPVAHNNFPALVQTYQVKTRLAEINVDRVLSSWDAAFVHLRRGGQLFI